MNLGVSMFDISKNKDIINQFTKFTLIGAMNSIIDLVILNILLLLFPTKNSLILMLFNTIAYSFAVMNSYIWNANWTFRHHATKNRRELFYFIIQAVVSLIINNIVFVSGAFLLGILAVPTIYEQNIAKGLAMLVSGIASFTFMRFIVFHNNPTKEKRTYIILTFQKRTIAKRSIDPM